MTQDLAPIDEALGQRGVDGYLIDAPSADPDQYYLSGFDAPDPFVTLYDGAVHLFFSRSLEYGRAVREANAETVQRAVDFQSATDDAESALTAFLKSHDIGSVAVPARFPLGTAEELRAAGIDVSPDEDSVVEQVRAVKTDAEIDHIRTVQGANQDAMARVEALLAEATVSADGSLVMDGAPLTSERVKTAIEKQLLDAGCGLDQAIVACAEDAADPHDRGSGPLRADEPIIVDIFPQSNSSRYNGDMTRTFVVGEPDPSLREWYDLTRLAFEAALDTVEAGATGEAVHAAAAAVYEDAGEPTLRTDEAAETGFIHSTGHGVGIAVHEQPQIGPGGGPLEPGHVITIEPGLYDPAVGGVRLEDLIVVTEDGYDSLTDYPMELVV
jgi:Xaa-Pro aminopeptidase